MSRSLKFFEASVGGRNVVDKFLKGELKKLPDVQAQLIDQLKVLNTTPIATLRETNRIEHVEGELFSFRFSSKDHWVRLLLAFWPADEDIVILYPLLKKQNKLDRDDIVQAKTNLRILKSRS